MKAGRAKLSARRGDLDEAEVVAREGVALAAGAEFFDLQGDALLALAEVLRFAGRRAEAAEAIRRGTRGLGGEGSRRLRGTGLECFSPSSDERAWPGLDDGCST